jgi:type II secretory pathway component PulF
MADAKKYNTYSESINRAEELVESIVSFVSGLKVLKRKNQEQYVHEIASIAEAVNSGNGLEAYLNATGLGRNELAEVLIQLRESDLIEPEHSDQVADLSRERIKQLNLPSNFHDVVAAIRLMSEQDSEQCFRFTLQLEETIANGASPGQLSPELDGWTTGDLVKLKYELNLGSGGVH